MQEAYLYTMAIGAYVRTSGTCVRTYRSTIVGNIKSGGEILIWEDLLWPDREEKGRKRMR